MKRRILKTILACTMTISAFTANVYAQNMDSYHVHEGDSLWEISQKYKIGLEEVIDANPQYEDPNLIYPDDIVNVPLEYNGAIGASKVDDGKEIGRAHV